jgi:mannose-6-phosphate isomerase-like protein (cupin superfamily)
MTVRANKKSVITENKHQNQLMFLFILSGSAMLETSDDRETQRLEVGTSVTLPSTQNFKLEITAEDTKFLLVEVGSSL